MGRSRHGRINLALLGIGIVLLAAAWKDGVWRNVRPRNFGVVEAGKVYRSGQLTPAAARRVQEAYGVRTFIDLGSFEPDEAGERRNRRTAEALGVERYVLDLEGDGTGNPNWYVHALRLMADPERQPVLVHCGAGSERTGILAALYRHAEQGTDLEEAMAEAPRFRHNPRRNPSFRMVVDEWGAAIVDAHRAGALVAGAEPIAPPEPTNRVPRTRGDGGR